jgi:hypothetical protein
VTHREFRLRRSWRELRSALRRPRSLRLPHAWRAAVTLGHLALLPIDSLRLAWLGHSDRLAPPRAARSGQETAAPPAPAVPGVPRVPEVP